MENIMKKETNEYDEIFKTILENKPEKQIDNDLFFKLKNSDKYNNAAIFSNIDIVIYLRDGYASIDKDKLKILKKREKLKKEIGNLKEKVEKLFEMVK